MPSPGSGNPFSSGLPPKQVMMMGSGPEPLQEQTNPTVSLGRSSTTQGRAAGECEVLQDQGQAGDMASPPQSSAALPAALMAARPHSSTALSDTRPRCEKRFAAP